MMKLAQGSHNDLCKVFTGLLFRVLAYSVDQTTVCDYFVSS